MIGWEHSTVHSWRLGGYIQNADWLRTIQQSSRTIHTLMQCSNQKQNKPISRTSWKWRTRNSSTWSKFFRICCGVVICARVSWRLHHKRNLTSHETNQHLHTLCSKKDAQSGSHISQMQHCLSDIACFWGITLSRLMHPLAYSTQSIHHLTITFMSNCSFNSSLQ